MRVDCQYLTGIKPAGDDERAEPANVTSKAVIVRRPRLDHRSEREGRLWRATVAPNFVVILSPCVGRSQKERRGE